MKCADRAVQQRRLPHFAPRDGQNVADEHVLQVLALGGCLTHRENRRSGRDGVADPDDRFLRNSRPPAADRRKDGRAEEREGQADPVDHRPVGVAVRNRQQQRNRGPERRNLREREIDENHAALDHMDAQIRVNAGKDEAGDEGRRQKREHG